MWHRIHSTVINYQFYTYRRCDIKDNSYFSCGAEKLRAHIALLATRYLHNLRTSYAVCSHSSKYSQTMRHEVFSSRCFLCFSSRDRAIQFSRACIADRRYCPTTEIHPRRVSIQHSSERRVDLTNRTRGQATPRHWPIEILYDIVRSHVRENAL